MLNYRLQKNRPPPRYGTEVFRGTTQIAFCLILDAKRLFAPLNAGTNARLSPLKAQGWPARAPLCWKPYSQRVPSLKARRWLLPVKAKIASYKMSLLYPMIFKTHCAIHHTGFIIRFRFWDVNHWIGLSFPFSPLSCDFLTQSCGTTACWFPTADGAVSLIGTSCPLFLIRCQTPSAMARKVGVEVSLPLGESSASTATAY